MVSIELFTPLEISRKIAEQAKTRRLDLNLSQKTLAERSGVSYGSVKKFEQSGQISLISLLKVALVLGVTDNFAALFIDHNAEKRLSLQQFMKLGTRKRGRK